MAIPATITKQKSAENEFYIADPANKTSSGSSDVPKSKSTSDIRISSKQHNTNNCSGQLITESTAEMYTPALRRHRRNQDKYVTDPAQLQLRFNRPTTSRKYRTTSVNFTNDTGNEDIRGIPIHMLYATTSTTAHDINKSSTNSNSTIVENSYHNNNNSNSSLLPRVPPSPETAKLSAENSARCRRYHPLLPSPPASSSPPVADS